MTINITVYPTKLKSQIQTASIRKKPTIYKKKKFKLTQISNIY